MPRKWDDVCARGSNRPTTVGGWTLTYIRVKGKWRYLYRAVDSSGATLDFLLSAKQDAVAAKRFSEQKRWAVLTPTPEAHQ
jgi:transposase-like protein